MSNWTVNVNWYPAGRRGPFGPQGPAGPTGPQGPAGQGWPELSGIGAPTINAAGLGQIYVRTDAPVIYCAIGTGGGAADWRQMSIGANIEPAVIDMTDAALFQRLEPGEWAGIANVEQEWLLNGAPTGERGNSFDAGASPNLPVTLREIAYPGAVAAISNAEVWTVNIQLTTPAGPFAGSPITATGGQQDEDGQVVYSIFRNGTTTGVQLTGEGTRDVASGSIPMAFLPGDELKIFDAFGHASAVLEIQGTPEIPSGGYYWLGAAALNGNGVAATSGQDVRNTLGSGQSTFDPNLFRGGRGLFTRLVTPTRATVTGNAAADSSGVIRAATVVSTGNDAYIAEQVNFPAGTFTIQVDVRSRTGADQQFRTRFFGKSDQTNTATTAWQTFTHTATITSGNIQVHPVASLDASSGLNVEVANIRIMVGSSGGAFTDLPNAAWGLNFYDTVSQPAKSADAPFITTGTGDIGIIEGLAVTCASVTFWSAFVVTGAPSFAGLIENGRNYATGSLWKDSGGSWRFDWGAAQARTAADAIVNLSLSKVHVAVGVYDGSTARLFLDGAQVATSTAVQGSITLRDLVMNRVNWITGSGITGRILGSGFADRAWDAYERERLRDWAIMQAATTGFPADPGATILAAEGDSITGESLTTYPHKFFASTSKALLNRVFAIPGNTLVDLVARGAQVDAMLPPGLGSRKANLSVLVGRNGALSYPSAAAFCAALKAYTDARRAAGWKVLLGTLLPATEAGFNARRNAINAIIYANPSLYCDVLIDFAGDPTMGPDAAAANLTYYRDGTHPTDAGYAVMAGVYSAAVTPVS